MLELRSYQAEAKAALYEYAFWDYFSIQDSEVIIHYHYWTHTDDKSIPKLKII